MSSEAVNWVLDHSPATKDLRFLLTVMARYTDKDGRGCRASEATIARNMGVTPRRVRQLREKARDEGHIKPGDQSLTDRYREGQKPVVYDLIGMPPKGGSEGLGGTRVSTPAGKPVRPSTATTEGSPPPPACTFTPDPINENFCLICGMPPINRRHKPI